jgi:ELWxxDGT repeat protein
MFFVADNGVLGSELWRTDGTAEGTVLVKDIAAGDASSQPASLTAVGSTVYFTADDGVFGPWLWSTDGTAAGTAPIGGFGPGVMGASLSNLTAFGSMLLFTAEDDAHGRELWVIRSGSAPTALQLSSATVAENLRAGAVVGTLSAADPDAGDSFQYTIVADASLDGSELFEVVGSELRTKSPLDFEKSRSHAVRVRIVDSGGMFLEEVVTVEVTNVNEAPTALTISAATIAENLPAGTVVGTLAAMDPDAGDTFRYTIVPDGTLDGTSLFEVVGRQLRTKAAFDFEAKKSYSVRVRGTDAGGLFLGRKFTITVTNVNEAPAAVTLSATAVVENLPAGSVVGTLASIDPDSGNAFRYVIVPDATLDGTGLFEVVGNQLRAKAAFDFEAKKSYSVRVRSTDQGGLFVGKVFTIRVTNVNEAPRLLALSSTTVAAKSPAGTVVGRLSAQDPDAGDAIRFVLVADPTLDGSGLFTIVGNELRTKSSLAAVTKGSLSIRVRAFDKAGLFTGKVFSITVSR